MWDLSRNYEEQWRNNVFIFFLWLSPTLKAQWLNNILIYCFILFGGSKSKMIHTCILLRCYLYWFHHEPSEKRLQQGIFQPQMDTLYFNYLIAHFSYPLLVCGIIPMALCPHFYKLPCDCVAPAGEHKIISPVQDSGLIVKSPLRFFKLVFILS